MARQNRKEMHFGFIDELCMLKGSEPPEEHPLRRYKGRVVFRGNQVKIETWEAALFKQMASQLASMLAAKTADAYGCLKGHTIQQADAIGAYTRAVPR